MSDHVVFDLETTSPDASTAKIVSMAFVTLEGEKLLHRLVNPGCPIPPGSTKVHEITDEDVSNAGLFEEHADEVQALVTGAVLCGYNSRRFDVPVLDRELREAGRQGIDYATVREIDAHQAWIALCPRTLAGAYQKWCGKRLDGAHDAFADAKATAEVINAMAVGIGQDGIGHLAGLSKPEWEIDRAGKFRRCGETGRALLNFGKHRGEFAANHVGLLRWMLSVDFPEETKSHIERWLA